MSSPATTRFDGPSSTVDLWDGATLRDPFPSYAALRAQGPAVRLVRHDLIAFPRYDEVAAALADWQTYSSASGVAVTDRTNRTFTPGLLMSDPPEHAALRRVLTRQLGVRRLDGDVAAIERAAEDVVDAVLARPDTDTDTDTAAEVDAVADLARPFGLTVVGDVVGIPKPDRRHLCELSARANDSFGPAGERRDAGLVAALALVAQGPALADRLAPGSRGAELIAHGQADNIASYTWPGLDTVARTVSSAVHLFARHPEQWDLLRRDPSLVPAATEEVLRLLSPIRHFTRLVTTDVEVGGVTIPAGSRVLLMFASANRDERRFPDPDRFDPSRPQIRHVAFGYGPHRCVGASLAHRAVHTLLRTLLRRVDRIEPRGEPAWTDNHAQLGLDHLPVRLVGAGDPASQPRDEDPACPLAGRRGEPTR